MRPAIAFFFIGALASTPSLAEQIQPGLWEVSSSDMQVDGQQLPAMQQMLEQLDRLPPEQRRMMEDMLAGQGVALGNQGVRVCLSEEQVKARRLPIEQEAGCTQEITESSASHWTFRYQCPSSKGEGVARFVSDREFTTEVKSTIQSERGVRNAEVKTHARWVSADCGDLTSG